MNFHTIAAASHDELAAIYSSLVVDRMKQDRWFSEFLEEHGDEMDPSDNTTPVWQQYRSKLVTYENTERLIATTTYYLKYASA